MRVVSQGIELRIAIMQLDKRNAQNSRLASTVISAGTHKKPPVQPFLSAAKRFYGKDYFI